MSGQVTQAIHDWFAGLVKSAGGAVLDWLGTSLVHTPDVTDQPRVQSLSHASVWIANTCYVLVILLGGITLMTGETTQSRYTVKEIAPRLVIGGVAANTSTVFISHAIQLANALSQALLGRGVDNASLTATLNHNIVQTGASGGILAALLGLVAVILALIVLVLWVVRLMMTVLLTAAAPLCLACHGLPQTQQIASWWWRGLACCLIIQIAQALELITAVQIWFTRSGTALLNTPGGGDDFLDVLLVICLLYVCARTPFWTLKLMMRTTVSNSPIVRAAKFALYTVVLRNLPRAAHAHRSAPRPRTGGGPAGSGRPRQLALFGPSVPYRSPARPRPDTGATHLPRIRRVRGQMRLPTAESGPYQPMLPGMPTLRRHPRPAAPAQPPPVRPPSARRRRMVQPKLPFPAEEPLGQQMLPLPATQRVPPPDPPAAPTDETAPSGERRARRRHMVQPKLPFPPTDRPSTPSPTPQNPPPVARTSPRSPRGSPAPRQRPVTWRRPPRPGPGADRGEGDRDE